MGTHPIFESDFDCLTDFMLDLHFIYTLLFGLGSYVTIPGTIRIENGKNGSWDISSDEATDYFIYTNYTDKIVNLTCLAGSLATYDCKIRIDNSSSILLESISIGQEFLNFNDTNSTEDITRVNVIKSETLYVFNEVIGWCYFIAWTVSFYPQIWLNFKRKTVEGLNFDFVLLNTIGFACYSAYNLALFFSKNIFAQYEARHHDGVNPVLPNDIFFSLHAFLASALTGLQIIIYDKNDQKVSKFGWLFAGSCVLAATLGCIAPAVGGMLWLDYLIILSSVKLAITIVKYIPQALMNYRRKSTEGWSIGNVLLDLTGGSLSMLQMMLQGVNNSDFSNIFGDPTKFGLGLFSIIFDVLFIVQHYVLYPNKPGYRAQLDDYNDY